MNGSIEFDTPAGSGGGGGLTADIQKFLIPSIWAKPAGAKTVNIKIIAGGGGGASGSRDASGNGSAGGGGGGGGGITDMTYPADQLPGSIQLFFSGNGTGGIPGAVNFRLGEPGQIGTSVTLKSYPGDLTICGAGGGGAGVGPLGGAGGIGTFAGGIGGGANIFAVLGSPATNNVAPGGGGAGGGITAPGVQLAANNGAGLPLTTSGNGGGVAGAIGLPGGAGSVAPIDNQAGAGGGGGGSSLTGNGGAGGNASNYGGGGGGGGAVLNNIGNSGAGGNGGAAVCIITTYCQAAASGSGSGVLSVDLTAKLATISETQAAIDVAVFGDSLGLGTGGSQTSAFPAGIPFAQYLSDATGYNVQTFSVGGTTSTQIKDRFLAAVDKRSWATIFEMGTNNAGSFGTVKADIATCVAALGHSRYLVCGLPLANDAAHWAGTSGGDFVAAANGELAAIYGAHFCDVRAKLVSIYNPALPQDVIDFSHNVPPTSAMYVGDTIHNNDKGYQFGWAAAILEKWDVLTTFSDAEEKIITNENALQLFKAAPPINTPRIVAKKGAINYTPSTLQTYAVLNGSGRVDGAAMEIAGNTVIWNEGADVGKEGGIAIRNAFYDESGKANMVIMGTNNAVWTDVGKGFKILNSINKFYFGSAVDFGQLVTLTTGISIGVNAATISAAGSIRAASIGVGSVFSTNRRLVDFGFIAQQGFLLPTMSTAEAAAQEASGDTTIRTRYGEMMYNTTTNRPAVSGYVGGYGTWKPLAYQSDILTPDGSETKLSAPLGDIIITGSGTIATPYVLSLLSTPLVTQLGGTPFGSAGETPGTNDPIKAFDFSFSTGWKPVPTNANNYVGQTFATPTVINKIYIYPEPGIPTINGCLFQGSNESTSSGFVTLYTFSVNPPDGVYTPYTIANTNAYRHYRLLKVPASRVDVRELGMFGYAAKPVDWGPYTPTGALDTKGAAGDQAYDDSYKYYKTETGWKRVAISTF